MDTLRAAFVPGLIAGIISVFTSWLWMGVIFHRYQRATPETWRVEGSRNYALSSIVRVLSAIAIAVLYALVARFHVGLFADGLAGAFRFAAAILRHKLRKLRHHERDEHGDEPGTGDG